MLIIPCSLLSFLLAVSADGSYDGSYDDDDDDDGMTTTDASYSYLGSWDVRDKCQEDYRGDGECDRECNTAEFMWDEGAAWLRDGGDAADAGSWCAAHPGRPPGCY